MDNLTNTKRQFWKVLDWVISLIIWTVGVTIAAPYAGFIAAVIRQAFLWGKSLF